MGHLPDWPNLSPNATLNLQTLAGIEDRNMAVIPMRLRLESPSGREGEEYRVYDGHVEVRSLGSSTANIDDHEYSWRRVTPEQLTAHVNSQTALAEWLKKRLGWRGLLRACTAEQDLYMFDNMAGSAHSRAA